LTIASIEGLVDQRTYFGKAIASKDMSGYFLLKNGEFAYNKSYSVGYDYGSINRLDKYDIGALSTLYICFALNEGQNSEFYNCYFNGLSWYNQMAEICAEGARNHGLLNVSANDFFNIRLTVPSSLEEQQKIADFLSSFDEIIAAGEQEVANLETQKKAVMKKIFSQEVRFKREDGSDFPEWEEKHLSDVSQCLDNQRIPINATERAKIKGNIPYYGAGNIQGYINKFLFDEDLVLLLEDGDAFDDFRTKSISQFVSGKCWINNHAHVLRPLENPYFLHCVLSHKDIRQWTQLAGQSRKKLTQENMMRITLEMPSLEEQRLIADVLSNFDEAISAAKKELELWKQLKKGLLQQMFV